MKRTDYIIVAFCYDNEHCILYSDKKMYRYDTYPANEYILTFDNKEDAYKKCEEISLQYSSCEVVTLEQFVSMLPKNKAAQRLLIPWESHDNERYYIVHKDFYCEKEEIETMCGDFRFEPFLSKDKFRQIYAKDMSVAKKLAKYMRDCGYSKVKIMTPEQLYKMICNDILYGEKVWPPSCYKILDGYSKLSEIQLRQRYVFDECFCNYKDVQLKDNQIMGVYVDSYDNDIVVFDAEGLNQMQRRNMVIDFFRNPDLYYNDSAFCCKIIKESGNIYFCK